MWKPKLIVPTFFATVVIAFLAWSSPGWGNWLTAIPAMIISYIFYLKTAYRKAPDPKVLLPLYLLGVCWYGVHFSEEYINGYMTAFPALFGAESLDADFYLIFNMVALLFYIFGGICIYLKIQGPQLIAIFFIFFGMIVNVLFHSTASIISGAYFPGTYTAQMYWLGFIGPWLYWKFTR